MSITDGIKLTTGEHINPSLTKKQNLIPWETHGIHVGTGHDHVKHGVDEIEKITEIAILRKYPSISFIIHTPRLTRYRYVAEEDTDIKFIRGYASYCDFAEKMRMLKEKYAHSINVKFGLELEWLGSGLGLQWNRSKILQVPDVDFIIGSVHFSREIIPYDGSLEEAEKLLALRGNLEEYWLGYIEELIEMVDCSWKLIQVVGHIDLPKLHFPVPQPLFELDTSSNILAQRMRFLLEMISDYNLALDLNLAGIKKKCGIYPIQQILKRARALNVPIAIGTDCHSIDHLGENYSEGIEYALEGGYKQYVSFSKCIPEKRPLIWNESDNRAYQTLNLGIEMLNRRFSREQRKSIPQFSFGGSFQKFLGNYTGATSLGDFDGIRIRRKGKSVTLSMLSPELTQKPVKGIFSHHIDKPGVLFVLFNSLASEGINVETALLNSKGDGTATAFLTFSGENKMVLEAIEFAKGSATDKFCKIEIVQNLEHTELKAGKIYLREMDGVELPIAISRQMILTVHNNSAGILLILLSALASHNINIQDLQLGERGGKGYAALGVEGDEWVVADAITHLGPQYYEVSHLVLNNFCV
ncbi:MAG: histidinol-phosphatase HisJ family protein [Candidatus Riflebacteria bacterium]|nr:histidinol-phosphatase HisJ family protein [Candidatus Riflebacteria bacterium]